MPDLSLSERWLAQLREDDGPLLDAAVRASLRGVNLNPLLIGIAAEDPRNRQAIARALKAAAAWLEAEYLLEED